MFDRFRYKFMQFMQGRYGADKFSQFLSGVILVLIILELIFRKSSPVVAFPDSPDLYVFPDVLTQHCQAL